MGMGRFCGDIVILLSPLGPSLVSRIILKESGALGLVDEVRSPKAPRSYALRAGSRSRYFRVSN
jgi:hypothetical protein